MARMKPNMTGGKINKIVVGPVWTTVTIRISSKHLRRKLKKK
jgi:molybdopterin-binding protein